MSPLRTRMMLAPDATTVPVCSPVRAERLTNVDDRRVVRVRVPIPVSALVDRVIADDAAASARRTSKSNVIEGALHDERAQGHAQRAQADLQPLEGRFERHLGRALAAGARNGRWTRLGTLDAVRLGNVMLDLAPDGEDPEAAPCTSAARHRCSSLAWRCHAAIFAPCVACVCFGTAS